MTPLGVLGIIGAVVVWALGVVLVVFNVARARVGRAAARMSPATRRQAVALIDSAGADDGTPVLLLRPDPEADDPSSRIGGDPVLPAGAPWPRDRGGAPARFLAQVRLQSPPLPGAWADRRVSLFAAADDGSVSARCDAGPGTPAPAPPEAGRNAEVRLGAVRLPRAGGAGQDGNDDGDGDDGAPASAYDPGFLCRRIPGLRDLLAPLGAKPERLLPYVLVPTIGTFEIDTWLVSLMGGDPELIQGEHDARCATCAEPMRFLLHVGDVLGLPGDAPIVYVYGCDRHTDQVAAFVDVH